MSIAAANVGPDLASRRRITSDDLRRLQDPVPIHEGKFYDDDGHPFHVYTVAGWLDGENIFTPYQGGATIGGDWIVVPVDDRSTADDIACAGLADTIDAANREEEARLDALAAQARLDAVNPVRRLELATAAEKNPDFVADSEAIRRLRGDDILLAAGGVDPSPPA
jgi:hypothetical protein